MILLFLACADGRALLSVPTTATASLPTELSFQTAALSLADLRMESPPETAALSWLIPTAHAHPGHDFAGEVAGELVGTWTLDLLVEATDLGEASMYEGDYLSARFDLPGEDIQPVVHLVGDGPLPFDLSLDLSEDITGLDFEATVTADKPPAGLRLTIDVAHMLSYLDWTDTDGDGVLTTADGDTLNTFLFGVTSTPTYLLTLE